MTPELKLILARAPAWSKVTGGGTELGVRAQVQRASGQVDAAVSLRVWSANGKIHVKEEPPLQWPGGCPERHINADGSFCLGIGDPLWPQSADDADHWWSWLHQFIVSQRVADRTGRWPSSRALHHGSAATYQLELERLSSGTHFEEEVHASLEGERTWLSRDLPRLFKDGRRLVNLRSPCPRGCHRRGKPILRRNCGSKDLVLKLIRAERMRRTEEARFWEGWKGRSCCQTMVSCPLRAQAQPLFGPKARMCSRSLLHAGAIRAAASEPFSKR